MANNNKTKLSQQQIFQRSFEENSDRIRVTLGDADDDITVNPNGSLNTIIQDADGDPISDLNPLHVIDIEALQRLDNIDSRIDGPNSTTIPLINGGIFYGPWTKRTTPSVLLSTYSDKNFSFYLQYANSILSPTLGVPAYTAGFNDGIEASVPYNYIAGVTPPTPRRLVLSRDYYRVVVVNNSGSNMTQLSVQTSIGDFQPAITRLSDGVRNDSDAELVRSVSTGEDPNGIYGNERLSGVSNNLSTNIPLLANQTYDSGWTSVDRYASAGVLISSDIAGSSLGLTFELSADGITVDSADTYTYKAQGGKVYVVPLVANFFRIIYKNGPIDQGTFRIQTKLFKETLIASSHRINDSIIDEDDAQLVKSVISGQNPDGQFVNAPLSGIVTSNSSSTPLGVGGVFQGPYFDTEGFAETSFVLKTDQAGIVTIDSSPDGVNIIRSTVTSFPANQEFFISQTCVSKYLRIRVQNTSGVAQTSLQLQTLMKVTTFSPTTLTISSPLETNSIALNTRSILSGQRENGSFSNVGLSNSASIKVAITDRPSEVRNRIKVEKQIFNTLLTTTPTVVHTTTPGKIFYLESMIISALNTANVIGEWRIANGASDKIGYIISDKTTGSPASTASASPALPEPIPFSTNLNVRSLTGAIQLSFYMIGYEEDI